ncbi:aminoacyl-tRNA hydrolase [Aquibacillus kalidii]|uniref:aminoacyl-tRNA hydrolase n=1 Tax=Aquibacillus kalidii TaxID=2762597 RepID=UPI00164813C5|nr:aminoacyl-tRNA hydrolase [Aquibacillus kalidii]
MKCIVGLGNPGKKYELTRHNIGFMIIDELARVNNWSLNKKKFNGIYCVEKIGDEKVILLEPQTYMNLSGESVRPLMEFYDISAEDVVVIYDDLDLPPGKIRLRQKGGHGGHNGIRSIIDQLGTKEFNRIRMGIGRPTTPIPVPDFVLGRFEKLEQEQVNEGIDKAVKACEAWFRKPFQEVMNEFN